MFPLLLQTANDDLSWPEALIAACLFTLITTVVVVVIWQVFGTRRARMSVEREEAYRRLAEESLSAQSRLAVQQQRMADDLTSMNERIAGIEKLLKEVG
jgi:hypothetical protein